MKNSLIMCLVSLVFSMSVYAQYDGSSTIKQKKATAKAQALATANLACRQVKRSCVDVLLNGSPYTYDSVGSAMSAVLKSTLEGESIGSLSFFPNQKAVKDLRAQLAELTPYGDRLVATTFVDFPTLPDIININDLVPPLEFMQRLDNRMTDDMMRMMARSGLDAVLAAIEEIKNRAGVGNVAPIVFAGLTLTQWAAIAVTTNIAVRGGIDIYNWANEDEDEDVDVDVDNKDKDKDTGSTPTGGDGSKITAESEWPMGFALYNMVRQVTYNWILFNQMRW